MTTNPVYGCLIVVECILLFELGIRLHHRPDTVSQHMAYGRRITRIDQIMDLGSQASEQMGINDEPRTVKAVTADLLGEIIGVTRAAVLAGEHCTTWYSKQ